MPARLPAIIDNRGENTALNLLRELLGYSRALDVATGCFEIGGLLELDGHWQQLERIRVLTGAKPSRTSSEPAFKILLG